MATAGRVLVVDDEPDVLSMLGDFLKEEGFRSLAFGAFDCVAKPIDPAFLLQSVETGLAMRRIDPGA